MGAVGGAPRDCSQQVEAADVLPSFASRDIRDIREKEGAAVEAKMLMVKGEQCSAEMSEQTCTSRSSV